MIPEQGENAEQKQQIEGGRDDERQPLDDESVTRVLHGLRNEGWAQKERKPQPPAHR